MPLSAIERREKIGFVADGIKSRRFTEGPLFTVNLILLNFYKYILFGEGFNFRYVALRLATKNWVSKRFLWNELVLVLYVSISPFVGSYHHIYVGLGNAVLVPLMKNGLSARKIDDLTMAISPSKIVQKWYEKI